MEASNYRWVVTDGSRKKLGSPTGPGAMVSNKKCLNCCTHSGSGFAHAGETFRVMVVVWWWVVIRMKYASGGSETKSKSSLPSCILCIPRKSGLGPVLYGTLLPVGQTPRRRGARGRGLMQVHHAVKSHTCLIGRGCGLCPHVLAQQQRTPCVPAACITRSFPSVRSCENQLTSLEPTHNLHHYYPHQHHHHKHPRGTFTNTTPI